MYTIIFLSHKVTFIKNPFDVIITTIKFKRKESFKKKLYVYLMAHGNSDAAIAGAASHVVKSVCRQMSFFL